MAHVKGPRRHCSNMERANLILEAGMTPLFQAAGIKDADHQYRDDDA